MAGKCLWKPLLCDVGRSLSERISAFLRRFWRAWATSNFSPTSTSTALTLCPSATSPRLCATPDSTTTGLKNLWTRTLTPPTAVQFGSSSARTKFAVCFRVCVRVLLLVHRRFVSLLFSAPTFVTVRFMFDFCASCGSLRSAAVFTSLRPITARMLLGGYRCPLYLILWLCIYLV